MVDFQDSPEWRPTYWQQYLVPLWERVNDIFVGLYTSDDKARYLRQQMGEHNAIYQARLEITKFEGRVSPSVKAHAGLFSRYELLPGTPKSLLENLDDVDGQGHSLKSWLLGWDIDALLRNASIAIIDIPPLAPGEDPRTSDRRPRLLQVSLWDVFAPKCRLVGNRQVIERIAIQRSRYEPDGLFGVKSVQRFEVYALLPVEGYSMDLATFSVWEKQKSPHSLKEEWMEVEPVRVLQSASGSPLTELPIVWYSPYGDPALFFGIDNLRRRGGTPEYMDLVDINIEYFNKHSELIAAESRINYSIPVTTYPGAGPEDEGEFIVGREIVLENGATMSLLEPSGTALEQTREGQRMRLARMDAIAQSFFTGGEVERTATEAIIESSQSRLGLEAIAHQKESAVQQVFKWWAIFSDPSYAPGETAGGIVINNAIESPSSNGVDGNAISADG